MPISNFTGGFANGLTVRGMPVLNTYAGNIFWLDSGAGSDGNAGTFDKPFATLDFSIGRCTASNGDQIHIKPGHTENIVAAGTVTFDVAGVMVVGHGTGGLRPTFTWTTATSATMVVSAANVVLVNLKLVAGLASIAELVDVSAVEGFEMHDCLVEDSSSTLEALEFVSLAAGVTGVKIHGCTFIGRSTDNNAFIQFEGTCDDLEIIGNTLISTAVQSITVALIDSAGALTAAVINWNNLVSQSSTITSALVDTSGDAGNTGMFAYNNGGVLDSDASAGEMPWDVTGMQLVHNFVADTVDQQGWAVPVIGS